MRQLENEVVFVTALICSVVLVLVLQRMAHGYGLVDSPGGRKQHDRPTPTVGGLAMLLAVAFALYLAHAYTQTITLLMGCAALLVVLGTLDDRHDLKVGLRLAIQAAMALFVILAGQGVVTHLGALFVVGDIRLGLVAVPFSLIAFIGGINAMNMIDGADGMAGKMAAITVAGVGIIAYLAGASHLVALSVAVLGALIGFLLFNTRMFVSRAWVFMGNAGSMWLGLVLGWLMAQVTHGPVAGEPALVLWLFGIPLVDTLAVITRRLRRHASPFSPDRTHIHHVFQQNGMSVGRTVHLLSLTQCLLVGGGVFFYVVKAPAAVVFWGFVLLMAAYFYLLRRFHDSAMELVRIAAHTDAAAFAETQRNRV